MSSEVITIIVAAASLLVSMGGGLFAGLAWVMRHMDNKFEKVDAKFDKIGAELGELRADLNDVKVAVARLEGPHPPLFLPR